MTVYLDTSSLVKLYVEERGSGDVRRLLDAADIIVTANIAYPETRAALSRRRRDRSLTSSAFHTAKQDFESDWPRYTVVPATRELCREAGELAERYSLRGFDAIHLASFGFTLGELQGSDDVRFSSFDDRLNRAATRLARAMR